MYNNLWFCTSWALAHLYIVYSHLRFAFKRITIIGSERACIPQELFVFPQYLLHASRARPTFAEHNTQLHRQTATIYKMCGARSKTSTAQTTTCSTVSNRDKTIRILKSSSSGSRNTELSGDRVCAGFWIVADF